MGRLLARQTNSRQTSALADGLYEEIKTATFGEQFL